MKNSKLIDLLKAIPADAYDALKDFVASPYFNKKERLIAFLAIMLNEGPDFRNARIEKDKIHKCLFPGQVYDDKRIRYLMSDLCKLLDQFMLTQRFNANPIKRQLDLLTIYDESGLEKYYHQEVVKLEKHFAESPFRNDEYFQDHLTFSTIKDRHFQQLSIRKFDENLQWVSDGLDRYYFLQKLKYASMMLDRQAIITADYHLNISKEWLMHLQQADFFDETIIEIYFTILMSALEEGEEHHFSKLKQLLANQPDSIPSGELADMYRFAINYCARKIRKGQSQYVEEALDLYVTGIDSHLFLEENHLSPWTFTNVVKLALRLKRYEWIASFIPKYAQLLPPNFRENALHYNYAELFYYTRDFDQALEHLNQVAYADLNYHLGARVMLAKIYFETEEENALLSLLAAFSVFLKRNKNISNNIKHTYLNFCDLLFQLVRRNPKKMENLKAKIEETSLLTDRDWLLRAYEKVMA